MVNILTIAFIAAWVFAVAHFVLDCFIPLHIAFNRVGGLRFWRFGRIGGSVYIRKAR